MAFYSSNFDKKLFHKVLVRQFKKLLDEDDFVSSAEDHFTEKLNELLQTPSTEKKNAFVQELLLLLDSVSETYEQFDHVLSIKSKNLELSSIELIAANNKLAKYNTNITRSIVNLKRGILELLGNKDKEDISMADFELEDLAELVQKLITKNSAAEKNLKRSNKQLKLQREELELKNRDILEGIEYARQIQNTILTDSEVLGKFFADSFVLNLPKEIVSGDFFWLHRQEHKLIIAVADCTGHGVPGAFTSIISNMVLNEIVAVNTALQPSEILSKLHQRIIHIFKMNENNAHSHEGLDIALCMIDFENDHLQFAGAGRPLILVRNHELKLLKGTNQSVGGFISLDEINYKTHEVSLEDGDMIYLFSDGYADQFGGTSGTKFSSKRFHQQLQLMAPQNCTQQYTNLLQQHTDWKMEYNQLDDILVLGFRYQIN